MAYLLDTDVFIQAKNTFYGFRICPAFWEWIEKQNTLGKVFSVTEVMREILKQKDELARWVQTRKHLFLPTDDGSTYESLALLSTWAVEQFEPAAQSKFFNSADFSLVGFASAHHHIVVTQETYADGFEIKLPKACKAMDVECINVFQLLEREAAKFCLGE